MKSNYKKLGPYIRQVNDRNSDLSVTNLQGVSITKKFIPSIANTIGTNMATYKKVYRHQFAYGPVTSRNGDKISVALLEQDEAIISQAYTVFEIIDQKELDPEYLMMWFRRPEFDRYARFKSHGSVREIFDWDEICDVELPIPDILEQRKIVKEYKTVADRIKLNKQFNKKLEESAQAIYKQWFIDFEFPMSSEYANLVDKPELTGKPYKLNGGQMTANSSLKLEIPSSWGVKRLVTLADIKGGKRLPKGESLTNNETPHPYIKVANMGKAKFVFLNNNFEYLTEETHNLIKRYVVEENDLIISIVGTIGLVRIIDGSLEGANLTENCVKVTNIKEVTPDYLYHYFNSSVGKQELEMRTVGGVQGKLPIYNVEAIEVLVPSKETMALFSDRIGSISSSAKSSLNETTYLDQLAQLLLARNASLETAI